MRSVPLGELANIVSGGTPKRSEPSFFGGTIPWVKIGDMLQGEVTWTEETITEAGLAGSSAKMLPAGTLLLSIFATIGRTAVLGIDAATNQAIAGIELKDPSKVDRNYLRHHLEHAAEKLANQGRGVAQANINLSILRRHEVPLPSIGEQQRIAAILAAADSVRTKRRVALTKLKTLDQAIFLDMFGDPAANPQGFAVKPLSAIAEKFSDGPFGSNLKSEHYVDEGVRVVRLQNIGVGEFIDLDRAFISAEHFDSLHKHHCHAGDVLVGTLGDPNLRACVQPAWLAQAVNKADCVQIRPDQSVATSEWTAALLNCPVTLVMARSLVKGQTRARISMGRLRDLAVPVPPLDLQRDFAARVASASSTRQVSTTSAATLDKLRKSLQQRAFAGNL